MSDSIQRYAITRRRFIQGTALAGVSAFLAACGTSGSSQSASAAPTSAVAIPTPPPVTPAPTAASPTPVPSPTGPLKFANWPAYIDLTGKAADSQKYAPGSSPTIEEFQNKYNVKVDYEEKIESNEDFYATAIQTQLVGGVPTGWDLIVVTDWMAARLISKGWVEQIDHSVVPNCVNNVRDALKGYPWDPTMDYHFPWQSGMTGLGYDSTALSRAKIAVPTKLADLWAMPADRVTFLNESRDTFGLGLLKLGKTADATTVTADDLQAVHDDIKPLVPKGLRFTGNDYLQSFASRTVWAAMVWSGDLASSASADQHFVFPEEGTMIWSDNMLIPKGAANKYTAELMMNWVYDPKIAAQIANYVYYVSPVKGAAEEIKKLDPTAATNPLLFPPEDVVAKQHNFQFLSADLEQTLNQLYLDLAGG